MAAAARSASAPPWPRRSRTAPSPATARTEPRPASPAAARSTTTARCRRIRPPVTVEHCTFVGNVDAAGAAGAIRGNYTGSYHTWANLRNCLLVNNQAPASVLRNFAGNPTGSLTASYASLGGNVTDEAATSAQFMPPGSDKVSNAALASSISPTLALNGGVTKTHAISRGSPAQRSGAALHDRHRSTRRAAPCQRRRRRLRTHRTGTPRDRLRKPRSPKTARSPSVPRRSTRRSQDRHDHQHADERLHHRTADARQRVGARRLFDRRISREPPSPTASPPPSTSPSPPPTPDSSTRR